MRTRTVLLAAALAFQAACGSAPREGASALRADSSRTLVTLANGRAISFRNDYTEGNAYIRYVDRGPVPRLGYHLVEIVYYEGSDFLLINPATGHQTTVEVPPLVSPGGVRVLVASMDYEAGYNPNLLQVWRVAPDSLVREWELRTGEYAPSTGWGASDAAWVNDTTVELVKNEVADVHGTDFRRTRIRLVRTPEAGWTIRP